MCCLQASSSFGYTSVFLNIFILVCSRLFKNFHSIPNIMWTSFTFVLRQIPISQKVLVQRLRTFLKLLAHLQNCFPKNRSIVPNYMPTGSEPLKRYIHKYTPLKFSCWPWFHQSLKFSHANTLSSFLGKSEYMFILHKDPEMIIGFICFAISNKLF